VDEQKIEGEILHIDRFGNLITNFEKQLLPETFHLEIQGRKVTNLQDYYAETGDKNVPFMIFGSAGMLEISAFQGSARDILGVEVGEKVTAVLNP
jgi:S-adenosylmethionine hydrolase